MSETTTLPRAQPSGTGIAPLVRHIVPRDERGNLTDRTLCGVAWDRANPQTGDLCEPCVVEYRKLRPGWPVPGGLPRG